MSNTIKIPLYWRIQVIAWSLVSLYWGYTTFLCSDFIWSIGLTDFLFDILIGITLTHGYRNFAIKKEWNTLKLGKQIPRIIIAVLLLSGLYLVLVIVKLYLIRLFILGYNEYSFFEFFKSKLSIFITAIRLMAIWILAYHLYHYSKREINIVKENARLSIIAKEEQFNNLTTQLNPHFLFNSLNTIKFLTLENPNAARRSIDLLSELLRSSLNEGRKLIPLKDEISLVNDYLELEKMRFQERLEISVEMNSKLSTHAILPLSIQLLVENAIKHGISKRKEGGFVDVDVDIKQDFILIKVQNSGQFNVENNNTGIGLRNLKERLSLQYNGNAFFEIKNVEEEIVLATILIPLI